MKSSKPQVIFCTDGIFPLAVGGMQRHSRLLIEELAAMGGLELIVIHPHAGQSVFNNPEIKEIALAPVQTSKRYLINCYNYSKQVLEILLQYPHAVIYSQGLSVWHGIGQVSKRLIVNPHGLEPYQTLSLKDKLLGTPFRLIFNHLFRNAAHVVSLGGRLTGILKGRCRNVVTLPNAVNVPEPIIRKFDNVPLQFLFVGRFAFNKGINILAEAVKSLNEDGYGDKMVFNLVGKGPLFDEYKKVYNFKNLNYLGFADDDKLNELYKTNDMFVLPTLFEGMPTVVLEAMAHGMPIIVTDVGATLEMVDDKNGFIIDKNSVDSLKESLLKYYHTTAEERKNLSKASYDKVKNNFTWKIVAAKHYRLFETVYATT